MLDTRAAVSYRRTNVGLHGILAGVDITNECDVAPAGNHLVLVTY
jgi:hypothetical protein